MVGAFAACAPKPPPLPAPTPESYVYRCPDDFRFVARFVDDAVTIRLGDRTLSLPRAISASGARYARDGYTFWGKGREALLETPSVQYQSCIGQRAASVADEARILEHGGGVPLRGTRWTLISLAGVPALPDQAGQPPEMEFGAGESLVSGSGGCNRFSGPYTLQGGTLHVGPLVQTRMACADAALNRQEIALLDALTRTRQIFVWGETLTLLADGEPLARFATIP